MFFFRMGVAGVPCSTSTGVDQPTTTLEGQDVGPSTRREPSPVPGGPPRHPHQAPASEPSSDHNNKPGPTTEPSSERKQSATTSEVKKKKGSVHKLIARKVWHNKFIWHI
mgnify:CR=1 FL=1